MISTLVERQDAMLISGHPFPNPTSSFWLEPSVAMGILLLRPSQVRLLSQRAESHIVGGEEILLVHPSSSSCLISDGDTFTVTGGWWGDWVTRWLWSIHTKLNISFTPKVCRYNILGFIEELPGLPAKRFGHACGLLGEVILKCIFLEGQKLPLREAIL